MRKTSIADAAIGIPLTSEENTLLDGYEAVIERGLKTFYEVGAALLDIRDNRLYRTYGTFEDYCRERWQMTRQRAYQLIDAASVVENVSTVVDIAPTSERQARPLTVLEPDEQRIVWSVVEQTAPGGKVTAAHVKSVVNVFREIVTTQAIDDGTGIQVSVPDVLKAVIVEETYERMMRQEAHIVEKQTSKVAAPPESEKKLLSLTCPIQVIGLALHPENRTPIINRLVIKLPEDVAEMLIESRDKRLVMRITEEPEE